MGKFQGSQGLVAFVHTQHLKLGYPGYFPVEELQVNFLNLREWAGIGGFCLENSTKIMIIW